MRKTLLYVVVAAAVSSLGVFAARQYAGSPSPSTPSKAFTEHITAYTSGTISNESGITIVLSGAPEKELDKRALARLFSFSPAIEGKVTWANDYTLTFKPNKPLPSNKKFKAKFRLGRIKEVASDLKTFAFQFQTLEQGLHVDVGGLQTPDPNAPASVELKGSLTTADWAANENIEQVLSATQRSKQLPIRWQHQPDSKSHTFTVADILRSEDKSDEVVIQWKGAPIGVSQAGERKVSLPELGKFQATGAYLSPTSNDCIIVNFSDPVDSKQELKGLLYLRNQSTGRQLGGRLVVESNLVYLYTKQPPKGDYKLVVERGVKNTLGRKLSQRFEKLIVRENIKPDVQLVGDGVILPSSDGLLFPFKAVSLSGVIVKIVQIPTNNVPQFLQINRLDQYKELKRVGRLIYKKKVALNKEVDLSDWNTFSLDLSQFIKVEPGAFYRVYLSFDRSQVLYPCTCTDKKSTDDTVATAHRGPAADPEMAYFDNPDDTSYSKDDYWYDESHGRFDYQGYRDEAGYSWDDRHNPCKPSYYMRGNHLVQRNVFASDLGIIAKRGDNKELFVAVSDLCTAQPLGKVELKAYNLQHQLVGQGKTSSEGMVKIVLEGEPFLLVAQQGKQIGYLQLNSSSTCSLSMFNVAGQRTQRGGLKGFIYGERGVWRPGDTVYLSFILEDKQHTLPANHPVIFELYNPHNQLHTKKIVTDGLHGFYSFAPTTGQDAPTGNWMAKVQVGGAVFTKTVKIETIKPNRLKAALDYDQTLLDKEGVLFGKLKAQWLHGALAKGLKADAQLRLFPTVTKFEGYANYTFDDPAKTFNSTEKEIFSGTLDQQGKGKLVVPMALNDTSPGMVKAAVNIRIFEKGGDFSIERTSIKYSPYSGYVGFHLPPGEGYNNALFSDQDNLISVVTVDERGRPVNRKKVKIEVFELKWRWWFDHSDADDFANYIQSNSTRCIHTGYVDTTDGKAIYNLNLDSKSWGRKYIRITDPVTNHSAGQVFYTDYTGYWQEQKKNTAGAEMLAFKTDKAKYQVGEQVTVDLPASKSGRALVSIESGSQILDTFWVPVTPQKHQFHFVATAAMAPNVYLHITYVQPHKERDNDLPIRLYGVQAIQVEDPNTHLQPVLTMPKTLAPETEIKIKVSEKQGKKMTYTLAMVDEGLLGITNFKTPSPWRHFYAREALGVKTWDMYQYVVGAFSGALSGLRAIGGDEEAELASKAGGKKANRFEPVVTYIGPIELKPGQERVHTFKMPKYIGAVKTTVIAGHEGAYGTCSKSTPVKKPLMVVATLPRVVGPRETVKMPVTVFATEKHIKNVTLTIKPNSFFKVIGSKQKKITISGSNEQIATFDLEVCKKIGIGKVHVTAQSGKEKATYEIELDVRLPNPRITQTVDAVIAPGKTWETTYKPVGLAGTNDGTLELAGIPPINLASRLKYLVQYPHGCVEQTTSAVFPQLSLATLMELTTEQRQEIQNNVIAGLNKLKNFLTSSGGFSYWPGEYDTASPWGTNYAGHFMLAAKSIGYSLPTGLLEQWVKYQKRQANQWISSTRGSWAIQSSQRTQAYRLYTLALAGKPAMGAMNRLRSISDLSVTAQWLLAGAYHLAGQPEAAQALVNDLTTHVKSYRELSGSYGSEVRDQAIILQVLHLLQQRSQAYKVAESLAKTLNSERWLSTQSTAYALLALSEFIGSDETTKGVQGICQFGQAPEKSFSTTASITQIPVPIKKTQSGQVRLTNTGKTPLFIKLQLSGIPLEAKALAGQKNLKLNIDYLDMAGNRIDPAKLTQGTDLMVEVHVHNPGIQGDYREMALMHHFPAGWEIKNERLDDGSTPQGTATYQDIRDDRVYSYFDLKKHETKTFRMLLNATYIGRYYLPAVSCEAMYDASIHAQSDGKWVEVVGN